MVLRAAERLDAFAVLRARLVDVLRDRGRPDEAHRRDIVVFEQAVDGDLVALHHVEAPVREPRLREEFGDEHVDRRVLLTRLEDERVAACQRVGEHPHRDHGGEVERRDACDHAERLTDRIHVDARRGLFGVVALDQLGDPARVLDVLEAAGDLAEAVGEHLAVLGGQQRRDFLAVRVDELSHPEHHFGASRQRRRSPLRERRLRCGHRSIDLCDRCEIDRRGLLPGGRVVHGRRIARRRLDDLPVDPVRNSIHQVTPAVVDCFEAAVRRPQADTARRRVRRHDDPDHRERTTVPTVASVSGGTATGCA